MKSKLAQDLENPALCNKRGCFRAAAFALAASFQLMVGGSTAANTTRKSVQCFGHPQMVCRPSTKDDRRYIPKRRERDKSTAASFQPLAAFVEGSDTSPTSLYPRHLCMSFSLELEPRTVGSWELFSYSKLFRSVEVTRHMNTFC